MRSGRLVGSIAVVAFLVLASIVGFVTGLRPLLGLDLVGGVSVVLSGPPGTEQDVMQRALDRIRERVDALGVAEPDISLIGSGLIQVQLPGLGGQGKVVQRGDQFCAVSPTDADLGCFASRDDAQARARAQSVQRVLQIIGTTARLEEREVTQVIPPSDPAYKDTPLTPRDAATGEFQTADPNTEVVSYQDTDGDLTFTDGKDPKYKLGKVEITGADLSKASAVFITTQQTQGGGETGWQVDFTLNKEGTQKFAEATTRLVGRQLAIVLDGAVESAPTVQTPPARSFQI